ncbi:MAG: arabinogalactan endo-1,4-beta-galactosidase [Muribaculaceae bacterium]|nr:arabinogalactan endo-1,4-beta-galactosidase [Muribaculaceae bacterium]
MNLKLTLVGALILGSLVATAEVRYAGGDISLLPEYENAGARYKTHEGKPIADVLEFCREEGMNAMRVRLFVNPDNYTGPDKDPNVCQTLDYIKPLCKRIKDDGYALMLDFHYSDTWADPAKQWTPKDWEGLNDEQLCQKIYEYTKDCLAQLKEIGATPDFIQTGNEISYGMLWGPYGSPASELKKVNVSGTNYWDRLCTLLSSAIKACREECPDAGIVLHTERVGDTAAMYNFYSNMKSHNVDYDIIGLSYYPYFHGNMYKLEYAINSVERNFADKKVMIVETGYSYKWEVPGTNKEVDYPYTDAGQNQFAKDLVTMLLKHPIVDGLFWWWMEYNAYGTKLSNWYNAPLFDSTNGKACSALATIASFATDGAGVEIIEAERPEDAPSKWYDLNGNRVIAPQEKGIYINGANGEKRLVF